MKKKPPAISSTCSEEECNCKKKEMNDKRKLGCSLRPHGMSRDQRKRRKRRSSCEREEEELYKYLRRLRPKKSRTSDSRERKICHSSSRIFLSSSPSWSGSNTESHPVEKGQTQEPEMKYVDDSCWIHKLPQEILLVIFSYLPLAVLLLIVPQVCEKWRKLSMDRTLWKTVEHLRIKSMVVTTSEVKALLRTIPKLKKLELAFRNDTEELLQELFRSSDHLEVLRLNRCTRSRLFINLPENVVKSILELCPKLKSVTLTDTYFRSRDFYRCLAHKFSTLERINISCTTKSEMDFFMDNLKGNVNAVDFQNVPMMGKADGKQIYWGPILGLVIRPNPTSPYHRQHTTNEFPNYAF